MEEGWKQPWPSAVVVKVAPSSAVSSQGREAAAAEEEEGEAVVDMKDGPESAESVKTAVSATNGGRGSNGDLLSPLSRDKTLNHAVAQSKQQAAAEGLVAIGAEDVVAAGDNGIPLTSLLQRSVDVEAVVPDTNGDTITDSVSAVNGSNSSINDDDDDKSSNNGNKSDSGNKCSNGGGDKVFICNICNRCFRYKHVLQNHERTHTGEKPFECPECHKRFTRDHHLKTHMRLHTGEKPYQCSHCDRHFVQVANLRRHLRVHTGERPYACQSCTSKFSDSNQLKAHMLIHRGEKPFQCSECLGRFRRRHHLIHHKCPKDEANVGKPRRGRRPKAYDHQLRPDDEDDALHMTDNEEDEVDHLIQKHRHIIVNNNNHNHSKNHRNHNNHYSPSNLEHQQQVTSPQVLPVWNGITTTKTNNIVNGNHNRKQPNHAISILTPQQRELFLRDKLTMQTQAIDMRVSTEMTPIRTVIVPSRSARFVEGVLDLSSSRSDSEIETMEEAEAEIQRDGDEDCLVEVDGDDDDLVDVVNGGDNHHCHENVDENSCGSHHNHHVRSVVKTLATFNRTRTDSPSSPIVVTNHNHNNHHNHHIRPTVLVGKVVDPINGIGYNADEICVNMRINGHKVSSEGDDGRQRNSLSPHPLPLTKKASIATA